VSTAHGRIFLSRLVGQGVFDPAGDPVGKVRDVVVAVRTDRQRPRIVGLVVEVLGRRRVFLPITRVTSLDAGQVITTGVLNLRKFEKHSAETLAVHELFDRAVSFADNRRGTVYDLSMERDSRGDWHLADVAVREGAHRFGRRGQSHVLDWSEISGLATADSDQGATALLATMDEMRPADLANALIDLPATRRAQVVQELGDERLADVLEELPDAIQVELLLVLDMERAADVLEAMDPDDAADLIADLPSGTSEQLLGLMEPDEAKDVRRLLTYADRTAGGLMTSEPVILAPEATLAEALARIRDRDLAPAVASMVYVCRPPLETPTGRFVGIVHFQALLREPPSSLVGAFVDSGIEWPRPDMPLEQVASLLASYDLVALPVVDENQRLLGAVTIDDVLDHLLPSGWREREAARG
jgi:CBS domain-containing protein/sporulation protein YlmC with PRC-barrel domain